ncbi:hypothetical protein GQ53DRAFT_471524 [Thozetella sp. PMI_491]|nr:hypothetical protein GQ53DRAFT_471524 [Thozetella sp. PMI_491]
MRDEEPPEHVCSRRIEQVGGPECSALAGPSDAAASYPASTLAYLAAYKGISFLPSPALILLHLAARGKIRHAAKCSRPIIAPGVFVNEDAYWGFRERDKEFKDRNSERKSFLLSSKSIF